MRATRKSIISILVIGLLAGSGMGVAAQDGGDTSLEPSAFRGRLAGFAGDGEPSRSVDPETGVVTIGGVILDATDPRVSGIVTSAVATGGVGEDVARFVHRKSGIRIVNEGGEWAGTEVSFDTEEADTRTKKQKRKGKGKAPDQRGWLLLGTHRRGRLRRTKHGHVE